MKRLLQQLACTVLVLCSQAAWAQFRGGAGDGTAQTPYNSPVSCVSFFGGGHSGANSNRLPNPVPCISFMGGVASGASTDTLLSTIPCVAYFGGMRDGSDFGAMICGLLAVNASELMGRMEGEHGYLWWTTYAEINNLGFSMQRSTDAFTWTEIAFVVGQTMSSSPKNYVVWDRDMHPGINYYRWLQYDVDGRSQASNIVALVNASASKSSIQLFPNPLQRGTTMRVLVHGLEDAPLRYEIIDLMGKRVQSGELMVTSAQAMLGIDTGHLSSGTYFLAINQHQYHETVRFIVL